MPEPQFILGRTATDEELLQAAAVDLERGLIEEGENGRPGGGSPARRGEDDPWSARRPGVTLRCVARFARRRFRFLCDRSLIAVCREERLEGPCTDRGG